MANPRHCALGMKIACPEEIAFRMGYIDAARLEALGVAQKSSGYGQYLLRVLEEAKL